MTERRTSLPPRLPSRPAPRPLLGPSLRSRLVPLLLSLVLLPLAACGAPESRPAEGPVAEDVEAALEGGSESFGHARWDRLLAEGTEDGFVDYVHFQRHRSELDAYLERIARVDLAALAPSHLEALLVNAYNAYTIRTILEHPEVSSIREIDGVWTERTHLVGGHELTLDEIEHNLLRPYFRDPRVHFAVNCASVSCAPLPPWAFHGDSLDAQFDRRTRDFLRSGGNVRLEAGERAGTGGDRRAATGGEGDGGEGDGGGGTLLLSRYFDWYGEDFTGEGWSPRAETIPLFVAEYTRPEVARFIREAGGDPPVRFMEYDWSLNAAVRPDPALAGTTRAGSGSSDPPSDAGWVATLREWVAGFGPAAPIVYGLVYVLATVLFVPGSAITIGAGVAFGLLWGTVLVSIASVTGAALAFLAARYLLRDRVESWVEGREKFRIVDRAVGREGWKIVALTRLSPLFPFNLLNYAYGLTAVGFRGYVLASWIAMLPGTLLYVYLGAFGAEVASAATGAASWGRTALQALGLLATLGVAVLAGRIATRALREAAEEGDAGDEGGGAAAPASAAPATVDPATEGPGEDRAGAPRP